MAWQNDLMLDYELSWITDNCTSQVICSAAPATYVEATSTYALGDIAMTSGSFTGPTDDTSGRKIVVDSQPLVEIDVAGNCLFVALVGSVDSVNTLMYYENCALLAVLVGDRVTIPAWEINPKDAA